MKIEEIADIILLLALIFTWLLFIKANVEYVPRENDLDPEDDWF